ncbi:MAG: Calx-beta domain-containing protein [Arenimonas sp.]
MRGWIKLFAACLLVPGLAFADSTAQTLPFSQDWTNTGLITANDNWSGVPGIEGYLGQDITTATGTNPQTLLTSSVVANDLTVLANQSSTTITNGDVIEFQITNPTIALQGSGTADAPYLLLNLNTSGQSAVTVNYNLRDIDGTTDNAIQPYALQYRVGNTGNFTNVPAGFVADASTGPSLATLVTAVSAVLPAAADNQPLVQVRIITTNAVGNDESVGIDDITATGTPSGASPGSLQLSAATYSIAENGGSATITVTRTGGSFGAVSVAYTTADGTATTADNDYAVSSGALNFIDGEVSKTFSVSVINDATVEPNETVNLSLSGPGGGATLGTPNTAVLTITNDDIVLTSIHTIQGNGDTSPLVGNSITTRGIVTGLRNNGFFLQTADADADADPATSQGIFVFTSSAPAVVRGDNVQVTANVVEFFLLTELSAPVISVLSSGNPMPASITLTAADGALATPERYESMRVTPNLTIVAPAGGNENEPNATATTTGNFYGVLPGVARPFREPGVSVLDAFVPAPGVTVFDGNLENIVVQSKGLGGANMSPNAGDVLSGITGILDFGFGLYKFYPDAGQTFTSTVTPTAVSDATEEEFTVAGFNLFRFFDSINDPANSSDPVLTTTALNNRLGKTAEAICSYLKTPDIIGVVEVENIGVLTQLADTINNGQVPTGSAVPACNTAPSYVPYLVEGNDVGGIDVGFLISSKIVDEGSTPRVEVLDVVQENDSELLVNPDSSTSTLNDRPTLRLMAVVNNANGASYPVTVMINHLRSLNDVNTTTGGSNGWASDGHRVRAKRLKQAESLARLVDARQVANPNEKIILLGDFNAFEFNDGFVDSMGIITGQEVPASEVTLHSGFVVGTPLTTLTTVDPANERYSFSFDGNAQSLDHAVINEVLLMQDGIRSQHARINSDFAVVNYGVYGGAPTRVSDHDPVIVYIKPRAFVDLDLGIAVNNPDGSINAGNTTTFSVDASNLSEGLSADNASISLVLDAAISGVNVTEAAGWTCAAPVLAAASTTITCSALTFDTQGQASFTVAVPVPANFATGDLTLSATISADQGDTESENNIASATVSVIGQTANLAIRARGPSTVNVGVKARINVVVDNYGPNAADNVAVAITTNAPSSAFKIAAPADWTCNLDGSYPTARFLCSITDSSPLAVGNRPEFVLTFTAPVSMGNTSLIVGTGVSSDTVDANVSNNEDSYSLFVNVVRRTGPPSNPSN